MNMYKSQTDWASLFVDADSGRIGSSAPLFVLCLKTATDFNDGE